MTPLDWQLALTRCPLPRRFSLIVGSAIAAVSVILCSPPARASAIIKGGEGTLRTSTNSGNTSQNCVCNPTQAGFAFPPLADEPLSESLDCPACQNPNTTITATTGPSHAEGAYIGDTHSLTFTTSGFGGGNSSIISCVAQSQSSGDIGFTVSDQPTAVSIGVSVTCSGPDGDAGVT